MCFDRGQEIGKQSLSFEDGLKCIDQPISGQFKKDESSSILILDDTKDVICENGGLVFHRKLSCKLAEDASHAMCSSKTLQRDGSWSDISLNDVRLTRGVR